MKQSPDEATKMMQYNERTNRLRYQYAHDSQNLEELLY